MPTITERNGRHQLRVKHRLLPKPYFATFETREEAEQYGEQLEHLLASGIVPAALAAESPKLIDPLLLEVIRNYTKFGPITESDDALLSKVGIDVRGLRVSAMTAGWVDAYVRRLKIEDNNSPGTIRKKVGVLARVLAWHFRRSTQPGEQQPPNPFRTLPRGYSVYTREDAAQLKEGRRVKRDVVRDRRLSADECARILAVLDGVPAKEEGKWRIEPRADLRMLFELIVDTGLRLSEAYSLRVQQLELDRGFTHVDGSKGHREAIKPRIVPLKAPLRARLAAFSKDRAGLLFSYWDGTKAGKKIATRDLVQLFKRTFKHAGIDDLTEHDLRHEACCRWFEMRGTDGRWLFSDVEICRLMGWSNYSMVLRYASIRGEDLAARLTG